MQLSIRCEAIEARWSEQADGGEHVDIKFSEIVIGNV